MSNLREGFERRLPVGADVQPGGVHFRVWAPKSRQVLVALGDEADLAAAATHELKAVAGGYFEGFVPHARANQFYRYRLDTGDFPDPASRCQPDGPHGASQIISPETFVWSDAEWQGVSREGQVLYEMHIGTFTKEGTWAAATEQLTALAELGVTLLEVMPVAEFPGRFGWGYDGVNLYAPTRLYGRPDDFRRFVNAAHGLGLGVILDVVYNHLGPDGNYLREFSPDYISTKHHTEWGEALNFDGENAGPVREFFIANAGYWIEEYHLDGLRFDATQQIFDDSPSHLLADMEAKARAAARGRGVFLVAENEPQHTRIIRSRGEGGYGFDAMWNDDFHHSAMVAFTGRSEAYYSDYRGTPQEFISAAKRGFLFQGQHYFWQKTGRGSPGLDLAPANFVTFLQNHDQVANTLWGRRLQLEGHPGVLRALTALLLLGPGTPMLFQGQEFAASNPFLYFADHEPELARLVAEGRRKFMAQFPSIAAGHAGGLLADPAAEETFRRSKLDQSEREKHREAYELHRDLLRLRHGDPVLGKARAGSVDGAVLSANTFVLRYFGHAAGDRLLLINLSREFHLRPIPEPLLAPPDDDGWTLRWSSENPSYGGAGMADCFRVEEGWILPASSALLFVSPHH